MEATATKKSYEITLDMRFKFVTIVLIHQIINYQKYFPINLTGQDILLDNYLKYMLNHGLLEIRDNKYIPTEKGRDTLKNFYARYFDYLKVFDIFCAVDLKAGEFAFQKINEFENDDDWFNYLKEERFSDVRVATAEFKGLDALEIVFMSFLNENRFEANNENWELLTGNEIWDEITNICETAIQLEFLKQNDVIQDVVKRGADLMLSLMKEQEEMKNGGTEEETIIEETTTVEEYVDIVEDPYYDYYYFAPYADIYYISPVWMVPLFLW